MAIKIKNGPYEHYLRIEIVTIGKGKTVNIIGRGFSGPKSDTDLENYILTFLCCIYEDKNVTKILGKEEFSFNYSLDNPENVIKQGYKFIKAMFIARGEFIEDLI